jgi:phospholipid/cholesterol/gamma-HCH transport system ATP-binding protein
MATNGTSDGTAKREAIIRVRGLQVGFGDTMIIDGLDLDVWRGEILGVVGASGTGKSVLLRAIIGLLPKRGGTVEVFGVNLDEATPQERRVVEQRWGILFQHGALFSSLTVKQNIQVPLREHAHLSPRLLDELAMLKLEMVGLKPEAANRLPSELSGGMIKRAALARALAFDPDIVFLDEPTSGLDPIGAQDFDELIIRLRDTLGLTVFMVTHDLDSLAHACDRIAALGDKKVLAEGPISAMREATHPWLKEYFQGPRARAALGSGAS